MSRFVWLSLVLSIALVFASFTSSPAETWEDDCGYFAIDSNESGGPVFEWVDISDVGEEVTAGLQDDNFIGPFNIGFDFPYYWYTVSQFWIGSNGYVSFEPGLLAQPMPAIPSTRTPNNFLAVYAADFIFNDIPNSPSKCYYYHDTENGRTIISFEDVRCWLQEGNQGDHTFQIILYEDGTIVYNYREDEGPISNNSISIGIENITGDTGIQNYFGVQPPSNYSIEFRYPEEIQCEVHDVAVEWALTETNQGLFSLVGQENPIYVSVLNTGTEPETNIEVEVDVLQGIFLDPTDYRDQIQTIDALEPGESVLLTFEGWVPEVEDIFAAYIQVDMSGDEVPANNDVFSEYSAVDYTGGATLSFCDDTNESSISWIGGEGNGMAVGFPVPQPTKVNAIHFFVLPGQEGATTFRGRIYDDSGEGGLPGNILVEQTLPMTTNQNGEWVTMDVSDENIIINDGAFYGVFVQDGDDQIGTDQAQPISRRSYEFIGAFSPYRSGDTDDVMIRADVELGEFATITGTVTAEGSGDPLRARVWAEATDGSVVQTRAGEDGAYTLIVSPGTWTVYAEFFGYAQFVSSAYTVENEDVITLDIALESLPNGILQGNVTDLQTGEGVSGATVTLLDVPIDPVMTDENGFYDFGNVPGNYTYTVHCAAPNYQEAITEFTVDAGQTNILNFELQFVQSFEGDDGGFSGTGEWEWGTPTPNGGPASAYEGENCWGTDLDGNYNGPSSQYLTTPEFELSAAVGPYALNFYHWYDTNDGWDGGQIQISVDGGDSWNIINPEGGYPDPTVVGLSGGPGYTGNSGGWVPAVFDLTDYAGETVTFRFRFGATNSQGYKGWFVDYFLVQGVGGGGGEGPAVSGNIAYWSNEEAIAGALVSLIGTTTTTALTDADGNFTVVSRRPGDYVLNADFEGDPGYRTITAFDAARVAQASIGLYEFNEYQELAGEVTGDGEITPFDAARIAQFAAYVPQSSLTGSWTFMPMSYSYTPLEEDMFDQNFDAVLYGDVSGNWQSALDRPSGKQLDSKTVATRSVETTVGSTYGLPEETIVIPVTVGDLTQDDIIAYQTAVQFDANVIHFNRILTEGTLSEAMTLVTSNTETGIQVVAYGVKALEGEGVLFNLEFSVVGELDSETTITLDDFLYNEGSLNATLTEGNVKVGYGLNIPNHYRLSQNFPNPFNPRTTIQFDLPVSASVALAIYDVNGRLVRTLVDGTMEAGYHQLIWDGTDANGQAVKSGVYFYRVSTDNFSDIKQMVLLK